MGLSSRPWAIVSATPPPTGIATLTRVWDGAADLLLPRPPRFPKLQPQSRQPPLVSLNNHASILSAEMALHHACQ